MSTGSDVPPALLKAAGITVRFGGLQALTSVDLDVRPGELVGLIGPNGAGKTTFFNVVCGLERPAAGHLELAGSSALRMAPHRRARVGLARTFQRLEVFGSLTVRENVQAAVEFRMGWARSPDPRAVADEIVARVGLEDVADARADSLPTGLARLVEVGRALATRPKLLLLDEPASGLDPEETETFAALLAGLCDDGLGILLVEHDVDLVMRICDRVFVLDFGQIIASGTPRDIQRDPAVQAAYLGVEISP
jgi:branched-chain amino acid transport system ATP-binding protein